jgi:hypothetical protein
MGHNFLLQYLNIFINLKLKKAMATQGHKQQDVSRMMRGLYLEKEMNNLREMQDN